MISRDNMCSSNNNNKMCVLSIHFNVKMLTNGVVGGR